MTRQVQPTSGVLRAANRASIVRVLRGAGWATRAELARDTGLSRATVSSVLGELRESGLLAERSVTASGSRGRPAGQVGLDRSAGTAIAVDIGVRHVAVAVGDLSHSVLAERWVSVPRGHTAARGTHLVLESIADVLGQADVDPDDLVGAAISVAAPVAAGGGGVAVPGVLPGWNGSTLAERVGERWAIPVVTENDANLGALGECVARPPEGDGDVLFVKVASRIGLGSARDKRIVRGRSGFAGEFGHVTARVDGDACWCGRRGCLELYAGGDGMLRQLAGRRDIANLTALVERAATDPEVRGVVTAGVAALARALTDLVVVLDPARLVLGGELTALGPLLVDPVRAELAALPFGPTVELTVSPLGERASLVGALSLVLTQPARFADHSHPRPHSRPLPIDAASLQPRASA